MADPFESFPVAPGTPAAPPPAATGGAFDAYPLAPAQTTAPAVREASGPLEALRAGFQGSAPGLAWRGKLPDLVINPEHATWWERALSGAAHVGAELPLMIGGAIAGAPLGAAAGTALGGPGAGTAAGSLLGAGAGMGAVPAAIRQTLIEAYKSGEVFTAADFWNSLREVAKTTAMEAGINAAAMGAGAVAGRAVGAAIAPKIGTAMTVATARGAIETADIATQIALMPTIPAAFQGRLPDAQEFLDAAILIGGLKAAHVTAQNITSVFLKTGRTPAEQVADAQANPDIARDITTPARPEPATAAPETPDAPLRLDMLKVQENLFRETARFDELAAAAKPLSDAERVEFNTLRTRIADLEAQLQTGRVIDESTTAPRELRPDQRETATALAETRIKELETKVAEGGTLTDAERAERVFLANNRTNPDTLAPHFNIEAAPRRLTAEMIDQSAQRVHDEVVRQVKEADDARRASGLAPLGDDHAEAVAALVRSRLRTRAARLGMLPEDLWNERPTRIVDETAPEVAAAEAAIPEDAPRFIPPEVDLFGNPVEVTNAPRYAVENLATQEVPLANLILSKEVPQFKKDANASGVIVPLGGKFDRTGVGPIQVWERLDGTLEVISGRHRLDLARRSGEETIPAQIHREADGFTAREASMLDAELNIREEQGSVADYVQYFKATGKTSAAANDAGLLARAKGKAGFAIARDGSNDLIAAHRAGLLSDEAAAAISSTAPGSERLQALGVAMVQDGKSILIAVNTMRAVDLQAAEAMAAGKQGDIFGFDDSAMKEAMSMAKKASAKQRQISEQISAVNGASKRPELAAKMGVNVEDPAAVQLKIIELRQEQYLWDNWPLYPELVAKLRGETLKQDAVTMPPETPHEATVRDAVASGEASRRIEEQAPSVEDIHAVADRYGIAWDNNATFMAFTKKVAGNRHLDKLDAPGRKKVYDAIEKQARTLYQDEARDTWYKSALGEAVKGANMKSAPAKGWLDFLKGQVAKGGVKADEIKWSGVEEWLQLQEGKVTKEQVADYLRSNGVKVEEVMLGQAGQRTPKDAAIAADSKIIEDHGFMLDQHPEDNSIWGVIDPEGDIYTSPGDADGSRSSRMTAEQKADWEGIPDNVADAIDRVTQYLNGNGDRDYPRPNNTKFSTYQLPGGENYRELLLTLLTLPTRSAETLPEGFKIVNGRRANGEQMWSLIGPRSRAGQMLQLPENAPREVAMLEAQRILQLTGNMEGTPNFQSSHFDQPNILAHIRFNERTDAEGKKVLFIEEFQSDWAQKGKKQGFQAPFDKVKPTVSAEKTTAAEFAQKAGIDVNEWLAGRNAIRADLNEPPLTPDAQVVVVYLNGEPLKAIDREITPEKAAIETQRAVDRDWQTQEATHRMHSAGLPPSAPFVGKTDAWVGLAIKRMIRYAAENGFDKIAWTRGEQQVERYTSALRKAVDVIEWKKTPEGVQLVGYKGKHDPTDERILQRITEESDAALRANDLLGFDTIQQAREAVRTHNDWFQRWEVTDEDQRDAINDWRASDHVMQTRKGRQKVVDTTEKEDALSDSIGKAMADRIINDPNQTGTIEGEGITVSDTGMAGFYDRIVPKVAKEVVKKLGGGKVGTTDLGKESRERWSILENEDGLWEIRDPGGSLVEIEGTERDAERAMEQFANGQQIATPGVSGKYPTQQPSIDITPEMRAKALEGLPLFQQHRGSYDVAENLITIMQGADKSTVVHELGHSWLEEMKVDAKREGAPEQIRQDWEILRRELAIGEDGEISRASHEQFARSVERYLADGDAPSVELRSVFERFKEWLLDIYRDLMGLNVQINPELKAVLDRMLATDEQIRAARELNVPRAYVDEAMAVRAAEIVPPPTGKKLPEPGFVDEQLTMDPLAKELLEGPGSGPTQDSRVNAQYINGPMDLKLAIQQVANLDQANIQRRRGGTDGVRGWEQANAEADQVVEDIMGGKMAPGALGEGIPHDVKQRAAFKVMTAITEYSLKLRDSLLAAGDNATVQQQFDYLNSVVRMRMAHAEFLGLRAASARALNQIRDMTPESGVVARMVELTGGGIEKLFQEGRTAAEEAAALKLKLEAIMAQHFSGHSALDIAKLHADIKDLKGNLKFAEKVTEATKWDMVIEGWRSGLLSGPVTHTTNLFGTGAFQAMRTPVDALAAIIGMARGASPGMGESDRASMSEAVARLTGWLGGVQDGVKVAVATYRLDDPTGKTEAFRTAIPGRAGEIIRIPLRLMGAEDALVSTMYTRGELRTLAIRQAFDEDMNPGTREFADRVQFLIDHPTEEMQAMAQDASDRMTFNAPLGEKGVALQLFVAKWNLQWMIPFIRTPINIAKELARMSPFAPIVGEWRAAIAKGGVERDRALAELAIGTGIMGITMAYAFSGQISGAGSPDPGKNRGKAGVEQPYSVLIGDKWYEYARIQPTGTLIGLAADIAAVWDHMTDEEKDKTPKMLAVAFSNAVTNQTFLQGITNFVNAMSDPTRFAPRFFQQLAGSLVPNIIGQPTTMADPVVREVNSVLEAVQARIPGMRQDLLPKRDWLGEPVQTKERVGVVLPSRTLEVSKDKVRLEAARLDLSMAAPPKKTHIGKGTGKLGDVELTPEEQDTFEKVGGEFAHKVLTNIVNAQGYDQIPDMVKRQIFQKVLTASHRIAAVAALPMEKRLQYIQSISEKVAAELQPGDTP